MEAPILIPSITPQSDIENDRNVTRNNKSKYLSLSPRIVEILRSEPGRKFLVRELIQITHAKPDAVRQVVSRLSKTGKGSGPIRNIDHGMYQYAPEKEEESLRALARSGILKAENLVFVTKGAQGRVLSLSNSTSDPEKNPESDTQNSSIPVPHECCPCPWTLPTGQKVTWEDYENGTEEIRISAKGAPPLSPDAVLIILRTLRDYMTDGQIWNCVSLELNIDSITHRLDYSYSLEIIEGLFLKAYQHGYNARIEIIDRRKVSLREVTELFQALAGGLNGLEALKEVHEIKERLVRCEKKASLAYTTAAKIRDGPDRDTDISHNQKQTVRKEPVPIFK
jgi:hypothetical protein